MSVDVMIASLESFLASKAKFDEMAKRKQTDPTAEALREVVSQCHNLPRTATADRIEAIARAALGDSDG